MPQYSDHNITFKEGDIVIMFDANDFMNEPKARRNPVTHKDVWDSYYKKCTVISMYQDDDSEWRCDVKFGNRLSKRHYCSRARNI
jgi:hypothetical protein